MGYYVSNEYTEEEMRENPPEPPQLDKLTRIILAESPRVTRFPCEFDKPAPIPGVDEMQTGDEALNGHEPQQRQHLFQQQQQQQQQQQEGVEEEEEEEEEAEEDDAMEEQ